MTFPIVDRWLLPFRVMKQRSYALPTTVNMFPFLSLSFLKACFKKKKKSPSNYLLWNECLHFSQLRKLKDLGMYQFSLLCQKMRLNCGTALLVHSWDFLKFNLAFYRSIVDLQRCPYLCCTAKWAFLRFLNTQQPCEDTLHSSLHQ